MTVRETLCQALNTDAEGGCSTHSVYEATKSGSQQDNSASHDQTRQQEPRTRPTTSYEATKPGTTANSVKISLHTVKPAPKHPTQRHTPQQASRPQPDRTQKTAGASPFGPAPTAKASRAPTQSQHKASEKLAETSASPDQPIGVASSFQTSFA